MGMFDNVRILRKLPWPEVQDGNWQSKDTEAQSLDEYKVCEDGTFWHLAYEYRFEENAAAPLGFYQYRDKERWERVHYSGAIEMHEYFEHADRPGGVDYSVTFWFRDGVVKDVLYRRHDTSKAAEVAKAGGNPEND